MNKLENDKIINSKFFGDSKNTIEEARKKYPLNIDDYRYIDTIPYEKLPYIILGVSPKNPYIIKNINDGKIIIEDLLKEAEIIRRIIKNAVTLPRNFDLLTSNGIPLESSQVIIINLINWIEYEKQIDDNFPISLSEEFIVHHKKRNDGIITLKERFEHYKIVLNEQNILEKKVDNLHKTNEQLSKENTDLSMQIDFFMKQMEEHNELKQKNEELEKEHRTSPRAIDKKCLAYLLVEKMPGLKNEKDWEKHMKNNPKKGAILQNMESMGLEISVDSIELILKRAGDMYWECQKPKGLKK